MSECEQDQPLLEQARAGDREALGRLLHRHEAQLYHTALRLLSNADDAREATQEAMVKIIRNLHSFQGDSQIATWMTRIVINQAISLLRKRKVRTAASLDTPPGSSPGNSGSDASGGGGGGGGASLKDMLAGREQNPRENVETNEMIGRLRQAVDALEEPFRSTLVLRDLDELDYSEIAKLQGVSLGTVKSRLFRARLTLREKMQAAELDVQHGTE